MQYNLPNTMVDCELLQAGDDIGRQLRKGLQVIAVQFISSLLDCEFLQAGDEIGRKLGKGLQVIAIQFTQYLG